MAEQQNEKMLYQIRISLLADRHEYADGLIHRAGLLVVDKCVVELKVRDLAAAWGKKGGLFLDFCPKDLCRFPSCPFFVPLPPQASKCSNNRFRAVRNA